PANDKKAARRAAEDINVPERLAG
ncbi:MAG: hypothetical protein K0S06_4491, partial [Microvirga sp.]|nr:hypothetical protein [Microvirga sp.]